jgi:hypothetical protein
MTVSARLTVALRVVVSYCRQGRLVRNPASNVLGRPRVAPKAVATRPEGATQPAEIARSSPSRSR